MNLEDFDPDTRLFDWQPLNHIKSTIPEPYRHWIHLPGSLTKALRSRSSQFSVEVLEESHIMVSRPIVGFDTRTGPVGFFSRKVLLKHGDIAWVSAHTLVPETSLRHGLGQLTHLKNRPLGELLFSTPGVTKDNIEVCKSSNSWGRRARYFLNNQPLLVSEHFLTDLITYEHQRAATLHKTHTS